MFRRAKQILVLDRHGTVLNLIYEDKQTKIITEIIATYKLTKIHRIARQVQTENKEP